MRKLIAAFKRVWLDAGLFTAQTAASYLAVTGCYRFHRNPDDVEALKLAMFSLVGLLVLLSVWNWRVGRELKKLRRKE